MLLWVKAFHIIAVVTWFAGLFYLPRLFVYHTEAEDDVSKQRFELMERRLYRGIMMPSMLVVFVLGSMLAGHNLSYYLGSIWFYLKCLLVLLLLLYHIRCGFYMRALAAGNTVPSSRYFRWFNEVPAVLLVAVILLVELQPW